MLMASTQVPKIQDQGWIQRQKTINPNLIFEADLEDDRALSYASPGNRDDIYAQT